MHGDGVGPVGGAGGRGHSHSQDGATAKKVYLKKTCNF